MERRELLGWMVATGGLAALNRLSVRDLAALGEAAHRAPASRALPASVASAIEIAAAHIIPTTDTPGASEANVAAFIAHMLDDWYPAPDRARFLAGVPELDVRARGAGATDYTSAPAGVQVAILEALDGEVTTLRASNATAANAHWFAMLKYLTVWGYCTSEAGMRGLLHSWPQPMRYDGNAPVSS